MSCHGPQEMKVLTDELCEQFTASEFRLFVGKLAPKLVHELFGEVPLAQLICEGLRLLERHGRLDLEFFVAWERERPAQRKTIAMLALHAGFELPPPPADALPPPPADTSSTKDRTDNSEPILPDLSKQDFIQILGVLTFAYVLYHESDSDNAIVTGIGAFLLCVLLPGRFGRENGAVESSITLIVGASLVGLGKYLDSQSRPAPAGQPDPNPTVSTEVRMPCRP